MSIQVHKNGNPQQSTQMTPARAQTRWEPFRLLRDLAAWDPFREMEAFSPALPGGMSVAFEVKETKDGFVFQADVPGMKESEVNVTLTGNRLAIAGKRDEEREEKTDTYYCYERSYGDFTRSFTLPEGVDANSVHADLKDGVLTVSIQKKPEIQPKKIPVQTAAKKS